MVFVCRPAAALVIDQNISDLIDGLFFLLWVSKTALTREDTGT